MTHWIRFEYDGRVHFGQLMDSTILVCEGDMFSAPFRLTKQLHWTRFAY